MPTPIPDFNVSPSGNGKVKAFSGSGVTANFETAKEQVEGEIARMKLDAMKQGFRVGTVQNAPPVVPFPFVR